MGLERVQILEDGIYQCLSVLSSETRDLEDLVLPEEVGDSSERDSGTRRHIDLHTYNSNTYNSNTTGGLQAQRPA